MESTSTGDQPYLVCRVATRLCALALDHVTETMRPLPIVPVAGVPPAVQGVAIVRGTAVPVVNVARALVGIDEPANRFVTVRVGSRCVALGVNAVVGIRTIPSRTFGSLPSLLDDDSSGVVAAMGALDSDLLVVLQSTRLVPDSAWAALESDGVAT